MTTRITGFDFARALAIFGMVIVNFKIAMGADIGSNFLLSFAGLFEGRASALFVILAGVGITFLTRKAALSGSQESIARARRTVIKRGLLLIGIGLLYTPIWEADILHFYGFYFLVAAGLLMASNRGLITAALSVVLLFPVLMLFLDYEKGWNWATLSYENLWTVDGMLRHIFFNGFHPVIPWCGFLLFGMWLGRQDLSPTGIRKKLLINALGVFVLVETTFYFFRTSLLSSQDSGLSSEEVSFLFSSAIIPPLPQYIFSATSTAVIVIIGSLYISERFAHSKLYQSLCKTGQLSLTLYVAHVIIGMGVLDAFGRLYDQTIEFSLFSALTFCACGMLFSVLWLKRFNAGPLEMLFRKLGS